MQEVLDELDEHAKSVTSSLEQIIALSAAVKVVAAKAHENSSKVCGIVREAESD